MTPEPEFAFEIDLDALPKSGRRFALEAGPVERGAIAKRLGVISVEHLSGNLAVKATKERFSVAGNVVARLKRECVATLAEMTEEIDEPFEIAFVRGGDAPALDGEEISLDGPECFEGRHFDIGEVLVQQLSLVMNPFPRIEGAPSLAAEFGADKASSSFGEALEQAIKTNKNQ